MRLRNRKITAITVAAIIAILLVLYLGSAPSRTPLNTIVSVDKGEGVESVSEKLSENGVVRSKFMLRSVILLLGGERKVVYGLYSFEYSQNAYRVAKRLMDGNYQVETVKLTIPEGMNRVAIADICSQKLSLCNRRMFLDQTINLEGYLFPDTYFFLPYAHTEEVIEVFHNTYEEKIEPLRERISDFGKTEKEVLTMASILEGEARQKETRRMVAGILWKRISLGMPLQVDTTFQYINGKGSAELTLDDLKIDSPYNTYVYKGLPPTPISNPGLESIEAAITPIKSSYLYFLTGSDGTMHYAKTHDEHVANKRKYLK